MSVHTTWIRQTFSRRDPPQRCRVAAAASEHLADEEERTMAVDCQIYQLRLPILLPVSLQTIYSELICIQYLHPVTIYCVFNDLPQYAPRDCKVKHDVVDVVDGACRNLHADGLRRHRKNDRHKRVVC